ncbi:MAG: anthranilate phosphoribosyltransferase, partial [Candidatus Zixiibacteriota bacterium]
MIVAAMKKALAGKQLTTAEASAVMDQIMAGQATPAQIAGFLIALKQKGETAEEVAGFVASMRRHAVPVAVDDEQAVDGCGTGGDGSHSFNISTAAAIVAAAAGATVAKHGNRSVSSRCGSADLLEATGANIDPGPERVAACLREVGFGFMFAPRFHPAMKHAAGPRKELGVRTVFNILGPMTNPAGVKHQLVGVYDADLMRLVAEVLSLTGSRHVLVVHARDGLDELSVTAPTDFVEWHEGKFATGTIKCTDVGLEEYVASSLAGGGPDRNLDILMDVLQGAAGPYRDAVLFNAGALLYVAEKAETIAEGVNKAAEAVDSGRARDTLKRWVELTK